jgi:hypothetical protein
MSRRHTVVMLCLASRERYRAVDAPSASVTLLLAAGNQQHVLDDAETLARMGLGKIALHVHEYDLDRPAGSHESDRAVWQWEAPPAPARVRVGRKRGGVAR